jgi:hypothetical protein
MRECARVNAKKMQAHLVIQSFAYGVYVVF